MQREADALVRQGGGGRRGGRPAALLVRRCFSSVHLHSLLPARATAAAIAGATAARR